MYTHKCNTTKDIYWLSQICSNGSDTTSSECVMNYTPTVEVIRQCAGIWLLVIGVIGLLGNLGTLLTIPYAAKQKRHNLDRNFNSTTIFILHLSFIDFWQCAAYLLPQAVLFLSQKSPFGQHGCKSIIIGGQTTLGLDMLGLALVALSRCFNMTCKTKWDQFCDKRRNIGILFAIVWLPNLLFPGFLEYMESHGTEPGWNCKYGACAYVQSCELSGNDLVRIGKPETSCSVGSISIWGLMDFYKIVIPTFSFVTIVISYVLIWFKVHQSKNSLSNPENNVTHLNNREIRMTLTILILIVLNFVCWIQYTLFHIIVSYHSPKSRNASEKDNSSSEKDYILYAILLSIFETQYASNFVIYVARSEQYRNAFIDGLRLFKSIVPNNR